MREWIVDLMIMMMRIDAGFGVGIEVGQIYLEISTRRQYLHYLISRSLWFMCFIHVTLTIILILATRPSFLLR